MSALDGRRVLVTGATGIVGWNIVRALAETSAAVRVLARNPGAAAKVLPAGVDVMAGDLTEPSSLAEALTGCDTVFHAAGMPEQWVRDRQVFHQVNVEGTRALVTETLPKGIP